MKSAIKTMIVFFFILMFIQCSQKNDGKLMSSKSAFSNDKEPGKIIIDVKSLEKIGFQYLNPNVFFLLTTKKYWYLLNRKDAMIARFVDGVPDKVYKHYGQGPAEFLNPYSLFIDDDKIAVFDSMRYSILFFDKDLNFLEEKKISQSIRKISKISSLTLAFGDLGDYLYAILYNNYKIIETFKEKPKKTPFENLYIEALYMGHILADGTIADTSWLYIKDVCKINILNPIDKKIKITLEWKNQYPQTNTTINHRKNMYSNYYVGIYGNFYFVQNCFIAGFNKPESYDLIIFDKSGRLLKKKSSDRKILFSWNPYDDSTIYFIDDEGNIYANNVNDMAL
jgi:hypothetical protein